MSKNDIHLDFLKKSIRRAYNISSTSQEMISHATSKHSDQILASIYLNKAVAIICSCKAIYYGNIENLQDKLIEDIFTSFDLFSDEFLINVSTNHSHDLTNIEFAHFSSAVEKFIYI